MDSTQDRTSGCDDPQVYLRHVRASCGRPIRVGIPEWPASGMVVESKAGESSKASAQRIQRPEVDGDLHWEGCTMKGVLFKVSVNYRHEMMTFLVQRGVLAENGNAAVRLMMKTLKLDQAIEWKALAEPTEDP